MDHHYIGLNTLYLHSLFRYGRLEHGGGDVAGVSSKLNTRAILLILVTGL